MKLKNDGPPPKRAGGGSVGPVQPHPFPPLAGGLRSTVRKRVVDEGPDLPPVTRFVAWPDGRFQYREQ